MVPFGATIIENLSELWLDEDDYLSQDLILIEKEAIEYKKTVIVFVSPNDPYYDSTRDF